MNSQNGRSKAIAQGKFPKGSQDPEILAILGQSIAGKVKSSASFGQTDGFAADLERDSTALLNAEKALIQAKTAVAEADAALENASTAFRTSATALVGHVNSVAKGDVSILVSAGLEVSQSHSTSKTTELAAAPDGLKVIPGGKPGEVELTWNKVKGARSYIIEQSNDPSSGFAMVQAATKAKATVAGRPSGQKALVQGERGDASWDGAELCGGCGVGGVILSGLLSSRSSTQFSNSLLEARGERSVILPIE